MSENPSFNSGIIGESSDWTEKIVAQSAAANAENTAMPVSSSANISHSEAEYALWGAADNLPDLLIDLSEKSAILPGIFEFWEGVLLGQGLTLFEETWDEQAKKMVVREVYDKEISPWLRDSGGLEYMVNALPDFLTTGNAFVQALMNKGSRSVRQMIHEFYHTEVVDCRLGLIKNTRIPHVLVGQFGNLSREQVDHQDVRRTPVDLFQKGKTSYPNALTMFHVRRKKAGRRYYGMPVWFSKETEIILKSTTEMFTVQAANLKNEVRPKFMIKIYKDYFKDRFPEPTYSEDDRQKEKEKLVKSVHDNLAKPENAGKMIWSDFIIDPRSGNVTSGIMIEAIESKYNSDAYLKSRDQAVAMLAMATNTNPGLADLIISGKLGGDTGSAVRESYNVLSRTKTFINRQLLLSPINQAMQFNWAEKVREKNYRVDIKGFELVTTDQDKSGLMTASPATQQLEKEEKKEQNED